MSTITREFTKEQLQQIIETDHVQCGEASALARIALASLEAEPYRYVHKAAYEKTGSCGLSNDREAYRDSSTHVAVYTAPPAPVSVPECFKRLLHHAYGMTMGHDWNKGTMAGHHRDKLCRAVEECRAAMLQGAEPVQGWIPCSERMPEKWLPVMVMYADGEMWSAIWTGTRWDDGTDVPDPHTVTHWQEMPAAPQQEAE